MGASMSDLIPDIGPLAPFDPHQCHQAALTIAEVFPNPHATAYLLVQLGLAVHRTDGSFHSIEDDGRWFSPRHDGAGGTLRLPVGALDDRR